MDKYHSNDDYQSFMSSEEFTPPDTVNESVLSFVHRELSPSHSLVFSKFIAIQLFVGFLTLLFCPQFDYSFTSDLKMFHFFHYTFGLYGCYAICGALFIGAGAIFATYLLNFAEIQRIRSNKYLYYVFISLISILLFQFLGANVYLYAALAWIAGALVGGLLMFELNRIVKNNFRTFQGAH